jgi:hypothetical protein
MMDETESDKPFVNTGNRVLLLLPLVWLYTVIVKMFTPFTFQYVGNNIYTLIYGLMIVFILSFASFILAQTKPNDSLLSGNIGENDEGKGFFWTNTASIFRHCMPGD